MLSGIFATFTLVSVVTAAPIQGHWHSSYGEALKTARRTGRPILVVIEDPTQSANASAVSFSKTDAEMQRESRYVLCRIDGTTEYGRKVSASFKATRLPFLAISDQACTVIRYQKSGQVESREWFTLLARYAPSPSPVPTVRASETGGFQSQVYRWSARPSIFGRNCPT